MLDNEKVDQFYSFLKSEYYNWWEPEKIILISPNHFHTDTKEIQTICESADVSYYMIYELNVMKIERFLARGEIFKKRMNMEFESILSG